MSVPHTTPPITDVAIVLAPAHLEATGLLSWAELSVGPVHVHGIAVRRTLANTLVVTWPARRDGTGRQFQTVTIADAALRRRVEAAVIAAYVSARARAGLRT